MLPNGEKIKHITVGGRTSAVVESRQKKIYNNGDEGEGEKTPKGAKKAKAREDAEEKTVKGKKEKENKADIAEEKGKRKTKGQINEEELTPKKRRVSENKATNGSAKSTPTRKSSRSKAS